MNPDQSGDEITSNRNVTRSGIKVLRPRKKCVPDSTSDSPNEEGWTKMERTMLLLALKKHGVRDVPTMCKTLTTKSEKQIRKFLNVCRRQNLKSGPDVDIAKLETWLNAAENATPSNKHNMGANTLLPLSFLTISIFEDHPHPSECGGIDYRRAYEAVYLLMSGLPLKTLNPPTAILVKEYFLRMNTAINQMKDLDIVNFLQQYENIQKNFKQPPQRNTPVRNVASTDKNAAMENLIKQSGFNPFGVPSHLAKKPGTNNRL